MCCPGSADPCPAGRSGDESTGVRAAWQRNGAPRVAWASAAAATAALLPCRLLFALVTVPGMARQGPQRRSAAVGRRGGAHRLAHLPPLQAQVLAAEQLPPLGRLAAGRPVAGARHGAVGGLRGLLEGARAGQRSSPTSMRSGGAGAACPATAAPCTGGWAPRSEHACRPRAAPPPPTWAGSALSLMRRSRSAGLTPWASWRWAGTN